MQTIYIIFSSKQSKQIPFVSGSKQLLLSVASLLILHLVVSLQEPSAVHFIVDNAIVYKKIKYAITKHTTAYKCLLHYIPVQARTTGI